MAAPSLPRHLSSFVSGKRDWGLQELRNVQWQPTPVFLPGKFHRQRSLVSRLPSMGDTKSQTQLSTHARYCTQSTSMTGSQCYHRKPLTPTCARFSPGALSQYHPLHSSLHLLPYHLKSMTHRCLSASHYLSFMGLRHLPTVNLASHLGYFKQISNTKCLEYDRSSQMRDLFSIPNFIK